MYMQWLMVVVIALMAVLATRWAMVDYRRWVGLGLGGLPHSLGGWLLMSLLRLFKRNGVKATQLQAHLQSEDDHPYLGDVIRRAGQRPMVPAYVVPQRQLTQAISADHMQQLKAVFDAAIQSHDGALHYKQSFFEKHHEAITLCHPECGHVHGLVSHGEVAHIHPVDGSMHMILSPSDAVRAIEAGWGELHGLAGFIGRLPVSYTFVYAPRNEQEIDVVRQLLDAAVAHMTERRKQACFEYAH